MDEIKTPKKPLFTFYLIALILLMFLNLFAVPMYNQTQVVQVDYGSFMDMTDDKQIDEVQILTNKIVFTKKGDSSHRYETGIMEQDSGLVERLHKSGAKFSSEIVEQTSPFVEFLVSWILPIIIFMFLGWLIRRQMFKQMGGDDSMSFGGMGGLGGLGKSNAKVYVKSTNGIKFSDVAGEEEAKENLAEIVNYLHDPSKYREIGARMPKGVLLVGPPGTGKTMLAKAVAGEANVPFFSMSGSEFVEMFVGMGASKVRDLFRQAKEKAPCIVFIDEIDAIGQKRSGGSIGGNDEREQTLNQLLTEMDGFEDNTGVIILAATNRPESLDPALTRPGRFDRRVPVELPDQKGREDILKVHAKKIKLADNIDFSKIASMATGASGAELANIVNEAALRAVRDGRKFATQADLEESIEVVIAGYQKKNAILTDKEKLVVAYHEVGHALVSAMQHHSAPVQKITIIPRTSGALGYTMQVDRGNHYLVSKEELLDELCTLTGGRAAEEVEFNLVSTGASNDIEKATKIARAMITQYGMSGTFGMVALETVQNQYLGGDASLACSAQTQAEIDKEVVALVAQMHQKAVNILRENKSKLDEIAQYLYEKETITGDEFMEILNRRPKFAPEVPKAPEIGVIPPAAGTGNDGQNRPSSSSENYTGSAQGSNGQSTTKPKSGSEEGQ
jgi:cell division protease FtsH